MQVIGLKTMSYRIVGLNIVFAYGGTNFMHSALFYGETTEKIHSPRVHELVSKQKDHVLDLLRDSYCVALQR